MGHWIKHFVNGTQYAGTDVEVAFGKASWTKSRQKGVIKVALYEEGKQLEIEGLGEYWQSDKIQIEPTSGKHKRIARRIEKKIEPEDAFMKIIISQNRIIASFNGSTFEDCVSVPDDWKNRWLVLEVDTETFELKHYIAVERI